MTITKIFAITINPEELPDFGEQALQTVLEAALTDDTPIFMSVKEVSISIPASTTHVSMDLPVQSYNNADNIKPEVSHTDPTNNTKLAEAIDVAAKNAKLRSEKGTTTPISEKLKDIKGTPVGELREPPSLRPTGEATPHNAPGKNTPCSNPKRIRETISGTGSIEFCSSCGFQYRDSDLSR